MIKHLPLYLYHTNSIVIYSVYLYTFQIMLWPNGQRHLMGNQDPRLRVQPNATFQPQTVKKNCQGIPPLRVRVICSDSYKDVYCEKYIDRLYTAQDDYFFEFGQQKNWLIRSMSFEQGSILAPPPLYWPWIWMWWCKLQKNHPNSR